MKLSAVIITLNEEKRLKRCLDAVSWADETVVVDGGSWDKTVKVAEDAGAKVFHRRFDSFSEQKNFALEKAGGEWILFIDADELVEEALSEEIKQAVKNNEYQGYYIPRSNIIFGKELKYGGHQGDRHLRLFRKDTARFVNPIHEKVVVEGELGCLTNPLMHYSTSTIKEYMDKLDLYSDLEAEDLVRSGAKVGKFDIALKPAARFLLQYLSQKGYKDGREGFVFYTLSAVNVFVKYAKYWEKIKVERVS